MLQIPPRNDFLAPPIGENRIESNSNSNYYLASNNTYAELLAIARGTDLNSNRDNLLVFQCDADMYVFYTVFVKCNRKSKIYVHAIQNRYTILCIL